MLNSGLIKITIQEASLVKQVEFPVSYSLSLNNSAI